MADSSIDITAGTGTSVDTRTEGTNGNHRQVIVVGDPATNAGVAPVDGTAGLKVDLGADNDVTVSGTVTVVATGQGDVPVTLDGESVTIGSSALPTGAATSANQSTANTALSAIQTAVELIDNTVSGTELQVDIVNTPSFNVNNAVTLAAGTNNIGDVDVLSVSAPTTIYNGNNDVTTAGTAEVLASAQALSSGVTVKAKSDNTGVMYVGDSSVDSSNGFVLSQGESIFLAIDNLDEVYIDCATSGDGVTYIGS